MAVLRTDRFLPHFADETLEFPVRSFPFNVRATFCRVRPADTRRGSSAANSPAAILSLPLPFGHSKEWPESHISADAQRWTRQLLVDRSDGQSR